MRERGPTRERGEREREKVRLDGVYCSSYDKPRVVYFAHALCLGDFFSWADRVAIITQI